MNHCLTQTKKEMISRPPGTSTELWWAGGMKAAAWSMPSRSRPAQHRQLQAGLGAGLRECAVVGKTWVGFGPTSRPVWYPWMLFVTCFEIVWGTWLLRIVLDEQLPFNYSFLAVWYLQGSLCSLGGRQDLAVKVKLDQLTMETGKHHPPAAGAAWLPTPDGLMIFFPCQQSSSPI